MVSLANIILLNGVLYINMIDLNTVMINVSQPVFEDVQSNGNVLTANYKGKAIKIIAGTRTFIYDKKIYYTDSVIFNIEGSIYMPIKSFLRNLGYTLSVQYDSKSSIQKSFLYYSKRFTYFVLQGDERYEYSNDIIYIRIKPAKVSRIVYLKMYDKISDDFLSKMKIAFMHKGMNLKIVSSNTITTDPTIVLKKANENLLWIDFDKKTNVDYEYYVKFGYDGVSSYSLVKSVGYTNLIVCPTTLLDSTLVGFVYCFSSVSDINIDRLVRGFYEFYQTY